MGQVHHGCATTTAAVRRAIQHSQASLRQLAQRYGINPKTVAKWRKRSSTADQNTGPTTPKSTVLSVDDETVIVAFRRHTLLPLDDCLYARLPTIPHLTRSALHRCLQRHGISRLPEVDGDKPLRSKFKRYSIGYFHIDIAEYIPRRAGSTCSWRLIGPPSSPSSSCTRRPRVGLLATSSGPLPLPFSTGSTPFLPTTARTSPSHPALPGRRRRSRPCAPKRCSSDVTRSRQPAPISTLSID